MENDHPLESIGGDIGIHILRRAAFGPIWIFGRASGEERITTTAEQRTNDALSGSKMDV